MVKKSNSVYALLDMESGKWIDDAVEWRRRLAQYSEVRRIRGCNRYRKDVPGEVIHLGPLHRMFDRIP